MLNSGRNLSVTHAAVRSTRTATISMSTRNSPATPPLRLHITSWVPMFATNAGILLTTQVLSLRPMISSRSGTTYDQVARNQDVVTTKPRTGGEESLRLPWKERASSITRTRRRSEKLIQLMSSVLPRLSTLLERSPRSGWEWWETIGTSLGGTELCYSEFLWKRTDKPPEGRRKILVFLLYSNNKFLSNNNFLRARAPTPARFCHAKHTFNCRRPYRNKFWKKLRFSDVHDKMHDKPSLSCILSCSCHAIGAFSKIRFRNFVRMLMESMKSRKNIWCFCLDFELELVFCILSCTLSCILSCILEMIAASDKNFDHSIWKCFSCRWSQIPSFLSTD